MKVTRYNTHTSSYQSAPFAAGAEVTAWCQVCS